MHAKSVIYLFFIFLPGLSIVSKTVISQSVKGDLNKDGIPDLAIVKATKIMILQLIFWKYIFWIKKEIKSLKSIQQMQ